MSEGLHAPDAQGLYPTGYCDARGRMIMAKPKPEWAEAGDKVSYKGAGGWAYEREAFEAMTGAMPGDVFVVTALKIRPSYTDYRLRGWGDRWFNTCMFNKGETL